MKVAWLRGLRAGYALSYAGKPRGYVSYAKTFTRAYMSAFLLSLLITFKYSQIKFCKSCEATSNRVTHVTVYILGVTDGVTHVTTLLIIRFSYE